MSASLRIEVESAQAAGKSYDSAAGPGYTQTTRQVPVDPVQQGFRDAIEKQKNEKETADRIAERERKERIAADRQERDEAWLARQEARAQSRQESEQEKRLKQQERDEDYAERQELRDQRIRDSEEERAQKRQEAMDKQAARQQERDEDYYARQQARDKAARDAVDPQFIANKMIEQQQLRQATQQAYIQATSGINPNGALNQSANAIQNFGAALTKIMGGGGSMTPMGNVNSTLASMASAGSLATKAIGGLGFVAGAAHAAWKHAIDTLLAESRRVAQWSPELRTQGVRNTLRDMQTDRQIARDYGSQMANVQDRENRQENALRLIATKLSSIWETIGSGVSEAYTGMLESFAGIHTNGSNQLKQLEAMGVLGDEQLKKLKALEKEMIDNAIANGMQGAKDIAQNVLKTLGGDLDESDPLKMWGDNWKHMWMRGRNEENAGLIPNLLQKGWNDG